MLALPVRTAGLGDDLERCPARLRLVTDEIMSHDGISYRVPLCRLARFAASENRHSFLGTRLKVSVGPERVRPGTD